MADNNSGGSSNIVSDGFGFTKGGTANEQTTSVLQKAEDSTPGKGDGAISDVKKPEEVKTTEEKPEVVEEKGNKSVDSSHRVVIEMLQDKFQQLDDGVISEDELKEWFSAHPELAETANRSKRLKETYRAVMEKPVAKVTTKEPVKEVPKKETAEIEKPLTQSQLQKILEERDVKILERTLGGQREEKFTTFAVKHGVVDEAVDTLKRNAEALFKTNSDWSYDEAMEAAFKAVNPQRKQPNHLPAGSMGAPEMQKTQMDASENPVQLISSSEFSGGQLKN